MKNKSLVTKVLGAVLIAFVLAIVLFKQSQPKKQVIVKQGSKDALVRPYSAKFGENKKNISIVEFLDPQCPSCSVFHPAVSKILADYGDNTQLVIRYLANHSHSQYAIKILESARKQNKFKEVLEIIFKYQNVWANHNALTKPELLWNYVKEVKGLDVEKLKDDFNIIDVSKIIAQDKADSLTLGVTGTPEFFVNGQKLEKLDYSTFDDLVIQHVYGENN